ncbi:sensor histidine kinase [Bacteroidota bacterium]
MLHYSGGVENPVIIYFIFHMIIASMTLKPIHSYLQTTLALILVGLLSFFEYKEIIPHYSLGEGFNINTYQNLDYLIGTGFIFVTTSYLIVFITSSIVGRQKRNQEALKQANMDLIKKDKIKNEYVIQITHTIKGHLAAIGSSLGVVSGKLIKEDKKEEFINRAYRRTSSLTSFVKDLLYITQMKLNYIYEKQSFSIKVLLDEIINKSQIIANEKSISLIIDMDDSINKINGNKFTINEVLNNLIGNAIKYSHINGNVNISVKDGEKFILFEISDDGIGVPKKDLKFVFDEFFRAGNAKKENFDGTGLGLSIVKEIIISHGGKIWVESEENRGSKFCFTLPK